MLTPAQRQELKGLAHPLKPIVLVGDKGLSATVFAEIDRALRVHELMKIRVGGEDREERGAAMAAVCKELNAEAVQIIGKTLVIYRAMTQEEREALVAKQVERKQRRIKVARRAETERKDAEAAARPRVASRPMKVGTKRSRLAESPIRGQIDERPVRARPAPQESEPEGHRFEKRPAAPRRTDSFGNNYGERADSRRRQVRDDQAAPPAETAGSRFSRNAGGARAPSTDQMRSPARTPSAAPRGPRTGAPRTGTPRTSTPRTTRTK